MSRLAPPKTSKEDDVSIDLPMPLLLKTPAPPMITVDNDSYDDSDVEMLDDACDSNNESEDETESSPESMKKISLHWR